jgi:hypothetical protein
MFLAQQQILFSHAIPPTGITTLQDSWVSNEPSVKMLCPQRYSACVMCSMSVHCIIRNNKRQIMHQYIYIIFIRESLLHVSTLLGHLQGEVSCTVRGARTAHDTSQTEDQT